MALRESILSGLFVIAAVVLLGRAVLRLLDAPDTPHEELVPAWERRTTTAVGLPCLLVGLSTMADGPLAVPLPPLSLTLFGVVASVYPNFTPSSLG